LDIKLPDTRTVHPSGPIVEVPEGVAVGVGVAVGAGVGVAVGVAVGTGVDDGCGVGVVVGVAVGEPPPKIGATGAPELPLQDASENMPSPRHNDAPRKK
jgi:hypothetical protein